MSNNSELACTDQRHRKTRKIFVAGGTGYIGRSLIHRLIDRGHTVRALVRQASLSRAQQILPDACAIVVADALDGATFRRQLDPCDTYVHLIGVANPSPAKAALFRSVDLLSVVEALSATANTSIQHFVYVSVTQFSPGKTPAMHEYVEVRGEAESCIRARVSASPLTTTILRPWYVIGPGHRWPMALRPLYSLAALVPGWREMADAMGLVTHQQMVMALVDSIENCGGKIRVLDVPAIRRIGGTSMAAA